MKSLLAKILLAQAATVVLALLIVMVVTRFSLQQGFTNYLERWETVQLIAVVPELQELYRRVGGWEFLRARPGAWERLMRRPRPHVAGHPNARPRPLGPDPSALQMHQLRLLQRMRLYERLFLLDAERRLVAGPGPEKLDEVALEPIEVEGEVVGWAGFRPGGRVLPPEARRFLSGQHRILTASLAGGLALAMVLGWALARHLSRPVRELADAVRQLAHGAYQSRAAVSTRDEIGYLAQQVNRLAATLEQNRTARQRWMADVAHELRTPVAIMRGEIEALEDGVRTGDSRMAHSLREEIDHLSSLLEDLQTLALADAGALNLRRDSTVLSTLVEDVADSYRSRLAARDISLELDIQPGLVLWVDAQRMRQLLQNLLENCCRYVQQGGRVRLQLAEQRGAIELRLEDDGPGVDPEQLAHLFRRFYRVEGSRSRAKGGSGLGLAICRQIAEAHGGSMTAEHSPLGGLALILRLITEP